MIIIPIMPQTIVHIILYLFLNRRFDQKYLSSRFWVLNGNNVRVVPENGLNARRNLTSGVGYIIPGKNKKLSQATTALKDIVAILLRASLSLCHCTTRDMAAGDGHKRS